jgi:UDP-3-O-[3-hydroxymyristoyl] glucosamine N-acyltransferase
MNRNTLLVSVGFMAVFALAITTTDIINTTGNKVGLLLAEAQQLASGVTVGNNTTMGSSVTIGDNTTMGSSVTVVIT